MGPPWGTIKSKISKQKWNLVSLTRVSGDLLAAKGLGQGTIASVFQV